jgi:hypothetical protein
MPPPWLAPHHRGTRRSLQLTEHRREHRAEQRREQLLVQRIEQVRNQAKVEVEVQVRIQVDVQVEMERKTRLTMQVSTQPALLLRELPGEQRRVLRRTQPRLRHWVAASAFRLPPAVIARTLLDKAAGRG